MVERPKADYYRVQNELATRVNLKEPYPLAEHSVEFTQASGTLRIGYFLDAHVANPQTKSWLLVPPGHTGVVTRGDQEFHIVGTPAVFFAGQGEELRTAGDFPAWFIELRETKPLQLEPTNPITEKIFQPDELIGAVDQSVVDKHPQGHGEIIRWVMGQWNSPSPLNIAYEGGGLGSIGDTTHKEPDVMEIHLVSHGRLIYTVLDTDEKRIRFPSRTGDMVAINPGTFAQMSRYSGRYEGYCIKWGTNAGVPIDPKNKIGFHPTV